MFQRQVFDTSDPESGIKRNLVGHVGDVTVCDFFPSGEVVLSAAADLRLKIWSVKDGSCPVTLAG